MSPTSQQRFPCGVGLCCSCVGAGAWVSGFGACGQGGAGPPAQLCQELGACVGHSWVWGGREDFLQAGALLIGECGRLFPCVLTLGAVGGHKQGGRGDPGAPAQPPGSPVPCWSGNVSGSWILCAQNGAQVSDPITGTHSQRPASWPPTAAPCPAEPPGSCWAGARVE